MKRAERDNTSVRPQKWDDSDDPQLKQQQGCLNETPTIQVNTTSDIRVRLTMKVAAETGPNHYPGKETHATYGD